MIEFSGEIHRYWMSEVLPQIADGGKSGILTVHLDRDILAVSFLDGDVVAADALDHTLEEGLRDVLVGRQIVTEEDFVVLMAESQAGGGRVVELLVERGYLRRDQLLEAVREQCLGLLFELARQARGEYEFYSGDEIFFEEGLTPITSSEALVRCAWELGGKGPLPPPVPEPDTICERLGGGSAGELPAGLAEIEARVLEVVDGARTSAQIVAALDLPQFDTYLALHALERNGLISISGAPEAAGDEVAESAEPFWDAADEAHTESWADSLLVRARPLVKNLVPWLATGALVCLAMFLAWRLHSSPVRFICPLPWEEALRERLTQGRRELMFVRIDNAAKTYYLIEKRFPENLEMLVERGLLSGTDLIEPDGLDLSFIGTEAGYVVQPVMGDETLAETGKTDGVAGNFLLDPDYLLRGPAIPDEAALVLLD